tara:strand:+ start:4964 stop:5314 length:351 start_codon:yes stop_codon:yes gene_type:complete
MKKILVQCTLDRAARKKDRSVSLTFFTDLEQTSEQFMGIDDTINSKGILYFKSDGELTQQEIDIIDDVDIEFEGKTKSQRLRNVLCVLANQQGFDKKEYYSKIMEGLIQMYKDKID